ncbi:hypothetical protein SUGI_0018600 [Cryptomeria japonica]|uniref:tryptophan N-monooxygenase CYP79A68 n=1 Tax=Cryptomeria japonica TaxID=3369 RepID=UPI002408D8DD|nr:tryptophan N-monooxygenase CYP79A68 [Cryptomeria japonica]GLJ05463.1 hypothetical protein SUGI_0018600 [Cryptomeria japonica]
MENTSISNASSTSLPSIAILWNGRNKVLNDQIHTDFAALLLNPTIAIFPTLVILVIISVIISGLVKSSKHQSSVALPPGPQPWPLVGNIPELLYNGPGYKWVHSLLHTYATPILCVRLGSVHVIAVNSPDIAREFLHKHDAIFASRPFTMATHYCSRGFLSTALVPWGDQWKKMRRALASEVLNTSRFKWLHGKRMEEADNLIHWIWNQCTAQCQAQPNALINIRSAVRHYSANMIKKLIFNRRFFGNGSANKDGGPGAEDEEYVEAAFKALSLLFNMSVSDYMPCLRWLDIGGTSRAMKKAIQIINKYHTPLIEERFRWRRGCSSLEEPQDLLDVMISIKDSSDGTPLLSSEEIKSQASELTLATVDNSSNAVEWALAEMLLQPEIMQKAVEEIDRVVGKDRLVEESDLMKLVYVKACAKEALRLHPAVPFNVPHMSMEDSTVGGYHIPKGTHVILSRVGLGRNPCVWEDPLRYCPDRFMKDGSVELSDPQLRLLSFSTGRRGCMGVALGTSMTIMLLARLLHCFHWSTASVAPIHLQEGPDDLFMATPLHAIATPRLPHHLYP